MNQVLTNLDGVTPTMVLNLWWLKVKRDISNARIRDPKEWKRQSAKTREGAEELLGEVRFAQYIKDETAYWLKY